MKINNDLVALRAPEPGDVDALFRHENAPESPDATLTCAPVSRRMLERYVENYSADIADTGSLRLMVVAADSGRTVGSVDLYDHNSRDRRAYVAIYIEESARRRGYGLAALGLLCTYASETLGLHQLAAEIAVGNAPSRGLFAKAGFKTCGRLRSWLRTGRRYSDVIICQRLFFN
jgi:diamine N-acetyltransferase